MLKSRLVSRYFRVIAALCVNFFLYPIHCMQLTKLVSPLIQNITRRKMQQNFLQPTIFLSSYVVRDNYDSNDSIINLQKEVQNLQKKWNPICCSKRYFDLDRMKEFFFEMPEEKAQKILEVVKKRQEISKNSTCTYNGLSIHKAIADKEEADLIRLLNKSKAEGTLKSDIESRDSLFMTPLHRAADIGAHLYIDLLLEAGADPNALTYELRLPLNFALEQLILNFTKDHFLAFQRLLKVTDTKL